jgi:predicted O-methyltransferase YrrM
MVETPMEMRGLVHELSTSAWTLASIGVLFESGMIDHLREPCSAEELATRCAALGSGRVERCLDVLAAAGVVVADGPRYRLAEGAVPFTQQPARAALAGEIRSSLMQALAFLDGSSGPVLEGGWRHTDTALLQAQGAASGGFPPMFKANIVGALGDLAARLERPGARFLDVGVGVGALSISMCGAWKELHVVGLDCFDDALTLARKNVADASLTDRVELRRLPVEELRDEASFDLAWLPAVFIRPSILVTALARVFASLRSGGWILLPVVGHAGDARQRAVWTLMNELWGGRVLTVDAAESLVRDAGFSAVRTLPGPAWAPALVVGQR